MFLRKAIILLLLGVVISWGSLYAQPANDNCANAASITQLDGTCNTFTTVGSTQDVTTGSCNNGDDNVWFTVNVPGPNFSVTVTGGTGSRPEIVFGEFSGATCSAFGWTELLCADQTGNYTTISLSTASLPCTGGTYYFYVTNNNNSNKSSIDVCVTAPTPPANDQPTTPSPLSGCDTVLTSLSNAGATTCGNGCGDASIFGCLDNDLDNNTATGNANGADVGFSVENDVYWSFCPTTNASYLVNIDPTSCTLANGIQFSAFQGPTTGQFDSLLAGGLSGQDIITDSTFPVNITNFSAGCVFFQIDGFGGNECDFNLTMTCTANCPTCVLPVTLVDFQGSEKEGKVQLNWVVTEEQNQARFEVERMEGEDHFISLGSLTGVPTAGGEVIGEFLDPLPHSGLNFYRLKMYDSNGGMEHSNTITVRVEEEAIQPYRLEKNPVSEQFKVIWMSKEAGRVEVEVYTTSGRKIASEALYVSQYDEIPVNMQGQNPGVYFYRIIGAATEFNGKFILQ